MNKVQALAQFITFAEHKDQAINVIVSSTNDEQQIAYTLTLNTVLTILSRCLAGEIDLDDLVFWANVIESRTDIDHSAVDGVIYALSNSEQMGELNHDKLAQLFELLNTNAC